MNNHLLILFGCWFFTLTFQPQALAESACKAEKAAVTILLTGFTRPETILDITPEVSGRCEQIRADIGQPIPDDTVFARIDPTFTELELKANAIAIALEQKSLDFNRKQAKRYTQLVTTKASAQTKLEELELKYEQSRLKLEQLTTDRERLQETLARHTIHAPAGWLLIKRQMEAGEWVIAGQAGARVGDYQHLVIPVAVSPEVLHFLQTTDYIPVDIIDSNLQGRGSIKRIAPDFDPVTRKIKVDIALNDDTLAQITDKRGGIRVEIPIIIDDPMQAFLLPESAVEQRYEEHWLTRENGETFRVVVLGKERISEQKTSAAPRLRVVSAQIQPGDRFQCHTATP